MIEIFENIPEEVKSRAAFIFDMAMRQKYVPDIIKVLNEYTDTCSDEEEREFVEFYFTMRFEELMNK